MKGKITNFKAEKGFGFIKGEDKKSYFFHISNVSNPMDIEENYSVDFKNQEKDKNLVATNITVKTPLDNASKDKILKIKDIRIRASDIKEYNISRHEEDGSFADENGKYHYILIDEVNNYYKYKGVAIMTYDNSNKIYIKNFNNFIQISDNELVDDLINLHYCISSSYYSSVLELLDKYSPLINMKYYKRYCYTLEIKTYTSGKKYLNFISHNEDINKKEAFKWLNYIDDEFEKLI